MKRFSAQQNKPRASTDSHVTINALYAKIKEDEAVLKMEIMSQGYTKNHNKTIGLGD